MSTATLGTWYNPPLAYVVAELVISPYYSMGDAVPHLQSKLRDSYPRTMEAQEILFDGVKPSPQQIWRLMSVDQSLGVQLGTRAISLHVTSYLHSSDFLTRWAEILDAVESLKLGAFVERAGLRYVDLIVPSGDRSPAEYLDERLQGFAPEDAVMTGSMWATAFQFGDNTTVNFRSSAPAPMGLVLPPDFNALPLQKPQVMLDAEERLKDKKPIGFIDTDCVRNIQAVFHATDLTDVYAEMQKLASRTFKIALSPLAKKEWE